jgi:hypothetical protein
MPISIQLPEAGPKEIGSKDAGAAEETGAAKAASVPMSELQLRALREYVRAYNRHDATAIASLYTENAAFLERGEFLSVGAEAIERNHKVHFASFPDTTITITRSWHAGNVVVIEYIEGGTQSGGVTPTLKKYGYAGASVLRFNADGKIEKDETYADELTKAVQLGWTNKTLTMDVRPLVSVPPAVETWDVHAAIPKETSAAAKTPVSGKGLLANGRDRTQTSESAFAAELADGIVLSAYDEPKDAQGKREVAAVRKRWNERFSGGTAVSEEGWAFDGYVVRLGVFTGKHTGPWGGLKPTRTAFKTRFLDVAQVNKSSKVERLWSYANNYELLSRLGYENAKTPSNQVR